MAMQNPVEQDMFILKSSWQNIEFYRASCYIGTFHSFRGFIL